MVAHKEIVAMLLMLQQLVVALVLQATVVRVALAEERVG
jgi:hypothetical protein